MHTLCISILILNIKTKPTVLFVILQGLCKLGSAGGTDFSMKQFAEGSTLKLAKQCRKYVCLCLSVNLDKCAALYF